MDGKQRKVLVLGLTTALAGLLLVASAQASPRQKSSRSTQHSLRKAGTRPAAAKHHGKHSRRSRRARGQRAPEPGRVQQIQQALIDRGFLNSPPTGKWDGVTVEAMRRFQRENGLNETGKFDAPSLIKLGLGPPTAGVGAPRELASATNSNSDGKH